MKPLLMAEEREGGKSKMVHIEASIIRVNVVAAATAAFVVIIAIIVEMSTGDGRRNHVLNFPIVTATTTAVDEVTRLPENV